MKEEIQKSGKLSVVGTPIGNLKDITYRAVETLISADIILCEDTRTTKKILDRYEIHDKKLSTWNEERSGVNVEKVVAWLEEGIHVALVSDAGTPGISDPGSKLVEKIRTHFLDVQYQVLNSGGEECGVIIEAIPGPSALTSAISISGVALNDFVFLGFLPHKKGRETLFKEIGSGERPYVFYESPHRILKTLESLQKFAPDKKVTICRELTKIHEEVVSGKASEILEFFDKNKEKMRGEFVVIVSLFSTPIHE